MFTIKAVRYIRIPGEEVDTEVSTVRFCDSYEVRRTGHTGPITVSGYMNDGAVACRVEVVEEMPAQDFTTATENGYYCSVAYVQNIDGKTIERIQHKKPLHNV